VPTPHRHLQGNAAPHRRLASTAWRDDAITMSAADAQALTLLPGSCLVLFLVQVDQARSVLAVSAGGFLDGLRAADALLSFSAPLREDLPLDELLPWAGSV
jgi:hypothetical protein